MSPWTPESRKFSNRVALPVGPINRALAATPSLRTSWSCSWRSSLGKRSPNFLKNAAVSSFSWAQSDASTRSSSSIVSREMSSPSSVSASRVGTNPIGRFRRLPFAFHALENPFQHARIVPEARPQKLAVGAPAEPVHVENLRRVGNLSAHVQPVLEIVAHVVAAEGQHGHGIAPRHADGCPVLAAVVSDAIVAPTNTPCCQPNDS